MKLYLAAPLFTDAERAFNVTLAEALTAQGTASTYLSAIPRPPTTTKVFRANLSAVSKADAVVAVCDGPQVDDGTAWEIGYAYGRNVPVYGVRTDVRIVHQPDERVNANPAYRTPWPASAVPEMSDAQSNSEPRGPDRPRIKFQEVTMDLLLRRSLCTYMRSSR